MSTNLMLEVISGEGQAAGIKLDQILWNELGTPTHQPYSLNSTAKMIVSLFS